MQKSTQAALPPQYISDLLPEKSTVTSEQKNRLHSKGFAKLNAEEKAKLKRDSSLCGLSQAAFLRMLIAGKAPEPAPPKAFWELLSALYSLLDALQSCIPYYPKAEEICKEIRLFLRHQYFVRRLSFFTF